MGQRFRRIRSLRWNSRHETHRVRALSETLPLRAAPPSRDWMDRIPERHAYRCLPLAIANAHG